MSQRQAYLDAGVGESRGVITLDGRPERLLIRRDADPPAQLLGTQVVGRVRKVERALGLAFVDLGEGPDGALNLGPEMGRLTEGQALAVAVRAEAHGDKGPTLRWLGEAEGLPRVLQPAPSLAEELAALAPQAPPIVGPEARAVADAAEDEALASEVPLPAGGRLTVERTRALIAVDVDVGAGAGAGGESKRAARAANLAAIGAAARLLRLKGEGGLVVIDLAGRGHDGPALLAAARAAFAPDNPGVALGPISRFGTLELTVPRRRRGVAQRLLDAQGRLSTETLGLRLVRAIEREALADPGARILARAAPDVAEAAGAYLPLLRERFGARLTLQPDQGRAREAFEVGPP